MKKILISCGLFLATLQVQAQNDTTEVAQEQNTEVAQEQTKSKKQKKSEAKKAQEPQEEEQTGIAFQRYPHNIDVALGGGLHSVYFDPKEGGDHKNRFGGTAQVQYRYAPTDRWSFGIGIGLTSYCGKSVYDSLSYQRQYIEPEKGDTIDYNVRFRNWNEFQHVINFEIPFGVYYRIPLNKVWGLVIGGGVKLDLPIYRKYKTSNSGDDEYMHLTKYNHSTNVEYGIEGEDMDQHGIGKKREFSGKAKMKGLGVSGFVDLGVTRPLKENMSLYIGAYFSHSLMNTMRDHEGELFDSRSMDYSGVVSSDLVKNTHLLATGVKVGLSFGFPKVDSAAIRAERFLKEQARLDSIAAEQARLDSIAAAEQARLDSIAAAEEAARLAAEKAKADSIANVELNKAKEAVAYINKHIRVNFELGKANVKTTPEVEENINFIVNYLNKDSSRKLVIYGHTCNLGKFEKNMELSKKRADAMKEVLVGRGCNANSIETIGKGPTEPLVPNTSEANRKKNRRIDIQIDTHRVE